MVGFGLCFVTWSGICSFDFTEFRLERSFTLLEVDCFVAASCYETGGRGGIMVVGPYGVSFGFSIFFSLSSFFMIFFKGFSEFYFTANNCFYSFGLFSNGYFTITVA